MKFPPTRRLTAIALATAGCAVAANAVPAQASALNNGPCPAPATSQPFAAWGDSNAYTLVPGGSFSGSATDWALSGNASLQSGGEPANVSGTDDPSSVALGAGAVAQSPFMCVDANDPTLRLFDARSTPASQVMVQVVYQAPGSLQVVLPVGVITPGGAWQPSPTMVTGQGLPGLSNGNSHGQMAVRFTGLTGSSQVDDVFVDPRMRG